MRYLIALLCPPLSILLCGHPFLAMFSILVIWCYFPAALLAILVVSNKIAKDRHEEHLSAIEAQTRAMTDTMKATTNASIRAAAKAAQLAAATPAPIPSLPPMPAPSPAAAPAPNDDEPKIPLSIKIREGLAALGPMVRASKQAAIQAYNDLPEWAQPITWGLAAGTPVSMAFVLFMALRK